jgi:excisionase family DNA binding protein
MANLLSVQEAARRLGLSFWTVYRWVRAGQLSSVHLGRRRLIPEEDLSALIAKAKHPSVEGGLR